MKKISLLSTFAIFAAIAFCLCKRKFIACVMVSGNLDNGCGILKNPILGDELVINYRAANLNERQKLMLDFAAKLTEEPSKVDNLDRNILRKAKFSDEEILEIIEVTSFFNMSNRIAIGTDMRPNTEYHNLAR